MEVRKHSLANSLRTGEFVDNLVDEGIANGMHLPSCPGPFPSNSRRPIERAWP